MRVVICAAIWAGLTCHCLAATDDIVGFSGTNLGYRYVPSEGDEALGDDKVGGIEFQRAGWAIDMEQAGVTFPADVEVWRRGDIVQQIQVVFELPRDVSMDTMRKFATSLYNHYKRAYGGCTPALFNMIDSNGGSMGYSDKDGDMFHFTWHERALIVSFKTEFMGNVNASQTRMDGR